MTQDAITWGMDGTWNVRLNQTEQLSFFFFLIFKVCYFVYVEDGFNFSLYYSKRLNLDKSVNVSGRYIFDALVTGPPCQDLWIAWEMMIS